MSANFDPSMGNYKNMTPFKMWCQKVLPQTYDDSLSYYEVLCKLKNHLNEVIENMDVLHDDVDALHVAYQQLEAYVNNYFDNLSVQTEINNKLDDMAEDGSLSELIEPFVENLLPDEVAERIESVVALQLGAVVAQQLGEVVGEQLPDEVATQVPTMVSAWLDDHVNPESDVVIDDSLTIQGAAADAKAAGDAIGELKSALTKISTIPTMRNGSCWNKYATDPICTNNIIARDGVTCVKVYAKRTLSTGDHFVFAFTTYDIDSGVTADSSAHRVRNIVNVNGDSDNTAVFHFNSGENGFGVSVYLYSSDDTAIPLRITDVTITTFGVVKIYDDEERIEDIYIQIDAIEENICDFPVMRNGSVSNKYSDIAIGMDDISPVKWSKNIRVFFDKTLSSGQYIEFVFTTFSIASGKGADHSAQRIRNGVTIKADENNSAEFAFLTNEKGFGVSVFLHDSEGVAVALRITDITTTTLGIVRIYDAPMSYDNVDNPITNTENLNARHVRKITTPPLTLLHLSDLHADASALDKIMKYPFTYDDAICTGDMVANNYGQITSWWNENVMTCMGNHDTASYSAGTGYDWTALSMADRDAYYIAPFESNWDIIHTSGTSYYYKDYDEQKVRLIVMDVMLYNDGGAEATTQNTWLTNLLSDAITNNLHVLIAIHAPHGGATAKVCSFSKYGQVAMPVNVDCNTPQDVIDIVASAITGGLHFIGYIVGHTHQDNIWDAENNGKQLMYCVTCANVSQTDQWKGSDLYRNDDHQAFNLITIDTYNTLVKIVRGGGANVDDHMRTRKAICFNYSTGEILGEIL